MVMNKTKLIKDWWKSIRSCHSLARKDVVGRRSIMPERKLPTSFVKRATEKRPSMFWKPQPHYGKHVLWVPMDVWPVTANAINRPSTASLVTTKPHFKFARLASRSFTSSRLDIWMSGWKYHTHFPIEEEVGWVEYDERSQVDRRRIGAGARRGSARQYVHLE